MPSENRRPKDDTWTSAELNKALKGSQDDMHRTKRRKDDDADRRHHRDELNGAEHRKEEDRRSHRKDEDIQKSKRHRDRGDSAEKVDLTEEERERMRQERRAKREGGKEEKKSRPKESKTSKTVEDDQDDRRRRRHEKDEPGQGNRKSNKEEESTKHKEDRQRERRQYEKEREKHREEGDREHKRHRDEDDRKRRPKEEGSSPHHKEEGSSRRHHDSSDRPRKTDDSERGSDRHRKVGESEHHKKRADDDEETEREKRRQERRERQEKERQKDKSRERDHHKEKSNRDSDRIKEKESGSHRKSEQKLSLQDREDKEEQRRSEKHRSSKEKEKVLEIKSGSEKRSRHRESIDSESIPSSNSHQKTKEKEEKEEDEYNYDEDFEDYDDDFEDEDTHETKEEGEMEEVLRALDEENNRLVSTSRRSNWSDSTELSDDRFKDSRDDYEPVPKSSKPKSFINFFSAKQRVMDHTVAGKARKRYEDLSKLIELDVSKFDMFDLPPVKEYELYIRSFGRSDTKQAYIQTRDDDIERDIQTDEIESLSKWTQHPPEDETAVGGEGINVQTSKDSEKSSGPTDPEKLNTFLNRVGQFLFTILDEESKSSTDEEKKKDSKPKASFSKKTFQLGILNFLKERQVVAMSFCQSEPNYLLSVHSSSVQDDRISSDPSENSQSASAEMKKKGAAIDSLSIICVWNLSQPTYPYRICGSEMKVTSSCFSPIKASLVFGGMHDGSVALWDIREGGSQHRSIKIEGQEHLIRFPTYNSARVLEAENHHSPVVAIVPVYAHLVGSLKDDKLTESSSGLSFQLASVEERAVVNLWVVAEIAVPDPAGSENDLGLAPGGKIKLLRSSSVTLTNPNKYLSTSQDLKALDLRLNPGDLNHFYVATDAGSVVHGVRFGNKAYPQSHSSTVDSPVPVVSIDFSPFGQPYFLAGCQDGTLYLFNTKMEKPVAAWREFISGETILSIRWSQSRPAVFFVLDSSSAVFTFDLVENGLAPVKMDRITVAKATCLELGGDPNLMTSGASRPAHMVLALASGDIEVLSLNEEMRQQQPLEEEFLACYVDRF